MLIYLEKSFVYYALCWYRIEGTPCIFCTLRAWLKVPRNAVGDGVIDNLVDKRISLIAWLVVPLRFLKLLEEDLPGLGDRFQKLSI